MHNNCINNLLNLKGVIVKKIENVSNCLTIYLETPVSTQVCTHCHSKTTNVHDYHTQTIKDILYFY